MVGVRQWTGLTFVSDQRSQTRSGMLHIVCTYHGLKPMSGQGLIMVGSDIRSGFDEGHERVVIMIMTRLSLSLVLP